MDLSQFGLFDLAERRLEWADQRQRVLAQNIANANTPGYQARDLAGFTAMLSGLAAPPLARTAPGHLPGTASGPRTQVLGGAGRALDRNGVAMESQLASIAQTETAQEFAVNIYRKYQSLFRVALGRGQ